MGRFHPYAPSISSADHVDLANRLAHATRPFPAPRKEGGRARNDLDDITRFVGVGAPAEQEMAELVTRHVTVTVARGADPDAGFVLAVRSPAQQEIGCGRLAPQH